ncbi:hypothetical protein BGZ50_002164 [Haplosporangium sp. Z 11]|nr:hypothetical protein BGZ50_002164 [Haplosporangium sp. Z 11]
MVSSVFHIPELAHLLAQYLKPPDILSCILVCRPWSEAFIPYLWHTVDDSLYAWPSIFTKDAQSKIDPKDCFNDNKGGDKDDNSRAVKDWAHHVFAKYGHHIRDLTLFSTITLEAASTSAACTKLRRLELDPDHGMEYWKENTEFIYGADFFPTQSTKRLQPSVDSIDRQRSGQDFDFDTEFNSVFVDPKNPYPEELQSLRHYWRLVYQNPHLQRVHLLGRFSEMGGSAGQEFLCSIIRHLPELVCLSTLKMQDANGFWALSEFAPQLQELFMVMNRVRLGENIRPPSVNGTLRSLRLDNKLELCEIQGLLQLLPNLEQLLFYELHGDAPPHCRKEARISGIVSSAIQACAASSETFHETAIPAEGTPPTRTIIDETSKSNLKSLGIGFMDDESSLSWLLGLTPNLKEYLLWCSSIPVELLVKQCKKLEVVRPYMDYYCEPSYIQSTDGLDAEQGTDLDQELASEQGNHVYREISRLMMSCQNLRCIDVIESTIHVRDIVHGGPWVCLGLEVLRCRINGICRLTKLQQEIYNKVAELRRQDESYEPSEEENKIVRRFNYCQEQHRQVYGRLAALRGLKILDLGYENRDSSKSTSYISEVDGIEYLAYQGPVLDTLELSLASGLDGLATLTQLTVFGFEGFDHRIGKKELEWIAVHWPKLKAMYGLGKDDYAQVEYDYKKAELRKYMRKLRPDVTHQPPRCDDGSDQADGA